MNILGISGSPRAGGNSEILLDAALAPLEAANWSVTRIFLSNMIINPCIGCETCIVNKKCFIDDDMQKVFKAFDECDAIIISAPSYWRNVPAQMKALIDRTFAVRSERSLEGKLGGAISVGRGTNGGQTIVLNIIYSFFLSCGTLCVPGELNGVTAIADKPGDILSQPSRLEQAETLGKNILKYINPYNGFKK